MHSLINSRKNHQESNVSDDKNEYKNKKYLIAFISQLNVAKIDSYLNCNKIIYASMFNIFSILIKMNKFSILSFSFFISKIDFFLHSEKLFLSSGPKRIAIKYTFIQNETYNFPSFYCIFMTFAFLLLIKLKKVEFAWVAGVFSQIMYIAWKMHMVAEWGERKNFILRTMFKYLFNKPAAIWWTKFPSRTQNVWMKRYFYIVSIWYAVLFYFYRLHLTSLSFFFACCLEQINRNTYRVYSSTILENAVHSSDCVLTIFMCSLFHGSLLVFNIIFLLLFFLFRNSQSIYIG